LRVKTRIKIKTTQQILLILESEDEN